jgi:ribonuclease HI
MEQQPASSKRCKPHASAASVIAAPPAPPAAAVFQQNHTIGISIHFDGGSRGNPGIGGCGAQLVVTETSDRETTERVVHCSKFLGRVTNNEAEYHGIILGLEEALQQIQLFAQQRYSSSGVLPRVGECSLVLTVYGDSDLVIQQMKGNYKVNSPNLRPLHLQAKQLVASLHTSMDTHIIYEHVYRADNGVADGESVMCCALL